MIIEIDIADEIENNPIEDKDIVKLIRVLCRKISEEGTIGEVRAIVNNSILDDK